VIADPVSHEAIPPQRWADYTLPSRSVKSVQNLLRESGGELLEIRLARGDWGQRFLLGSEIEIEDEIEIEGAKALSEPHPVS